jgi:hypothetical protein
MTALAAALERPAAQDVPCTDQPPVAPGLVTLSGEFGMLSDSLSDLLSDLLRDRVRGTSMTWRSAGGVVTDHETLLQVVDCLEAQTDLLSPATRAQLITCFERRAGRRLFVPEFDIPRDWVFRFVEGCFEIENGVEILVDAVHDLRPGGAAVDELSRIIAEHVVAEVAASAGDVWELLRRELSAIPVARVARPFREACFPAQAPAHCGDAWQLFLWAANRERAPAALPPYTVFLALCTGLLSPFTRVRVDAWQRREAHAMNLTPLLDRLYLAAIPRQQPRTCVVAVEFQPVGPEPEQHHASWWLRWDGEPPLRLGVRERVTPDRFEGILADAVSEAEEVFAAELSPGEHASLIIEVFLPFVLLELPVIGWRRDVDGKGLRLLIKDYPVILRSLDRARRPGARFLWLRRWAALMDPELPGPVVARAGAAGASFAADHRVAAVVLSGPPRAGTAAQGELLEALRSGVPVAAWQSADPDRPSTDVPLAELLAGGRPADLAERFQTENLLRLGPPVGASEDDDEAVAARRGATLLLDDPRRGVGGSARLSPGTGTEATR